MSTTTRTAHPGKVLIEQPVATVENTSPAAIRVQAARWRALDAEQAVEGYYWTVAYQGIVTFAKRGHPDRYFTTNLAHQIVPCDLWGHAIP
jgi:hypothetical protein